MQGEKLSKTLAEQWSVFMGVGDGLSSCSVVSASFWVSLAEDYRNRGPSWKKGSSKVKKVRESGDESNVCEGVWGLKIRGGSGGI